MVIVESREMYSSSSTFRPPQGHHNHHPGGPLSNNNGSHRNNGGGGKVYVGNLSTEVTDEHLFDFFVSGGIDAQRITKVVVKSGFAFVEFVDQVTVDEAVAACNGKPFMNTVVRVEQSFRTSENSRYQPSKLIQVLVSNCKFLRRVGSGD
jgi:RNA recognition motif-containing protein